MILWVTDRYDILDCVVLPIVMFSLIVLAANCYAISLIVLVTDRHDSVGYLPTVMLYVDRVVYPPLRHLLDRVGYRPLRSS